MSTTGSQAKLGLPQLSWGVNFKESPFGRFFDKIEYD